jgi:hypothetical protein
VDAHSLIRLRERTEYPQLTDVPSDLRVNGARHASRESLPPSKGDDGALANGATASMAFASQSVMTLARTDAGMATASETPINAAGIKLTCESLVHACFPPSISDTAWARWLNEASDGPVVSLLRRA